MNLASVKLQHGYVDWETVPEPKWLLSEWKWSSASEAVSSIVFLVSHSVWKPFAQAPLCVVCVQQLPGGGERRQTRRIPPLSLLILYIQLPAWESQKPPLLCWVASGWKVQLWLCYLFTEPPLLREKKPIVTEVNLSLLQKLNHCGWVLIYKTRSCLGVGTCRAACVNGTKTFIWIMFQWIRGKWPTNQRSGDNPIEWRFPRNSELVCAFFFKKKEFYWCVNPSARWYKELRSRPVQSRNTNPRPELTLVLFCCVLLFFFFFLQIKTH